MTNFNKTKTPIGINKEYTTDDLVAYTMEYLKNAEGESAHVGGDKNNITLGYGVVAQKVKYNGSYVESGKFTDSENFDESKLEWQTAVYDGIKASDYETQKDFATAVVKQKIEAHKEKLDTSKSKDYNLFKLSAIWNGGASMLTYSGFVTTMGEIDKPVSERNPSMIFDATRHAYYRADGKQYYSIGISKRNAALINKFVKEEDKVVRINQAPDKKTGMPVVSMYNKNNELVYSFNATREKSPDNKWGDYDV